jgi:hypothetical protein
MNKQVSKRCDSPDGVRVRPRRLIAGTFFFLQVASKRARLVGPSVLSLAARMHGDVLGRAMHGRALRVDIRSWPEQAAWDTRALFPD